MMKWAQGALSAVAGTAEPIYGPEAIRTVTKQAETTPYTELEQKDAEWLDMGKTSVETQTFYLHADSGHIAVVQVIHSSVMGISTSQFTLKVFYPRSENKPNLWSSNALSDVAFENDRKDYIAGEKMRRSADSTEEFYDLEVRLSEDGKSYYITSFVNPESNVNLKVTRTAPGFQVGNDGTTYYGEEAPPNHWGSMRHRFWPRSEVTGTIHSKPDPKTGESKVKIDFKGKALLIHALQGMKPHHAAGKWKFVDFQGPTYSAIMMEFTTPPSYGSTVVNVGGIVKDGEIITAGAPHKGEHTKIRSDSENDWPEPEAIRYAWNGKTKDGKAVDAVIEGPLGERLDRIDVMAEVPGFVKTIVASAAGTKPYIYQYSPEKISLKIKIGDEEVTEEGQLFTEATFITECD